ATATVPLAVGLIHAGASPGAALAFLIAGPATNAATIATIWKVLGRRTAAIYLATIAASAVVSGLLIDGLFPGLAEAMPAVGHLHAHATIGLAGHLWAASLLTVLAVSFFFGPRLENDHGSEDNRDDRTEQPEQQLELAVEGMTCSHCAEAVRRALTECPGVASARVDLAAGRAVVSGTDLDARQLADAVGSLGYQAKL
ncbi:MAG: cation transporter, partial [Thermoguttaceae bacterium]